MDDGELGPADALFVPAEAVRDDPAHGWVDGTAELVDACYAALLRPAELAPEALRTVHVDHFRTQAFAGGFSQYVYNARWEPLAVGVLRHGLRAVGAPETAALFDEGVRLVASLGPARLAAFLESRFFGPNPEREVFGALDRRLQLVLEREDLRRLNAAAVQECERLRVEAGQVIEARLQRWHAALPDREARQAEAQAAEPRYRCLARAACAAAAVTRRSVTAGAPTYHHEGAIRMGWHHETDPGP
ncbi:MAG: hypothetical protein AAF447_25340, partial [Myxococcota bacterium]